MKIIVQNMKSEKTGREVANQFLIHTDEGTYFQSYDSIIAFKPFGKKIQLDEKHWNYSRTTSKYRNLFLNETTRETRIKIENDRYELVNLN